MEATFDQAEFFPAIAQQVRPKSRFRQLMDATESHGCLFTPVVVAVGLGISRQRVHVFIDEGRLATVEVCGHRYVPASAVELFLAEERKNGRPLKEPRFTEAMAAGFRDRFKK